MTRIIPTEAARTWRSFEGGRRYPQRVYSDHATSPPETWPFAIYLPFPSKKPIRSYASSGPVAGHALAGKPSSGCATQGYLRVS
jgi:hypothetical protein